jgi:hypothetical protein
MPTKKTIHGGRVVLSVNGNVLGRWTGVNPTQSFGNQPQYELGSIFPYEIVSLRFTGSVTVSRFMVERQDFSLAGIPAGATDTEADVALKNLLSGDGVSLAILDRETGEVILTFPNCKCDTFGVTVTANAVVVSNATFQFGTGGPMRVKPLGEQTAGYSLKQPDGSTQ